MDKNVDDINSPHFILIENIKNEDFQNNSSLQTVYPLQSQSRLDSQKLCF